MLYTTARILQNLTLVRVSKYRGLKASSGSSTNSVLQQQMKVRLDRFLKFSPPPQKLNPSRETIMWSYCHIGYFPTLYMNQLYDSNSPGSTLLIPNPASGHGPEQARPPLTLITHFPFKSSEWSLQKGFGHPL